MVVINKKKLTVSILSLTSVTNCFAEMMEKGRTKLKTVFNFYHQNSDNGNQVYDDSGREEANVVEPMIFVAHQVDETTEVHGHFVFDSWTAASDTKLDERTGESGEGIFGQGRGAGTIGVRQEINKWEYDISFGVSSEYDYRSINGSVSLSHSMAKDNFVIAASLQYFADELDLFKDLSIPADAKIGEGFDRDILATTLSATQILTPKDLIQFELLYSQSSGHLESTANTVKVAGARQVENLPESRDRYAISTKWVHGIGEAKAINSSLRYYEDSWEIQAVTSRLAFLNEYNDDEDFYEFFLRHHYQSQSEYYQDQFVSTQNNMTSDSDNQKFNLIESGIYITKALPDYKIMFIELEDMKMSHSIVFAHRSNGMRWGYYQFGFGVEF